jgi:hypothetical protein
MPLSVKKILDSTLAMLLEKLAADGFAKGGDLTLIRSTPDSICSIDFQPDKYNTKSEGKFAVNVSLWYPELARERGERDDTVHQTGGLHLTQRLAMLALAPGKTVPVDKWWEVSQSTDPRSLFKEIHSLWEQLGRRWLAENENLSLALPRIVRQGSGYYAATALFVAGDIAAAKETARTIWKGKRPGYPERIEWAWKRRLFDIEQLKAVLGDESPETQLIALDTLWKIARFDSSIAALAGELAEPLTRDPDQDVALRANDLRRSLYLQDGALRIIPREIPSLKKLPRNAITALAGRCARRVEANIAPHWKGADRACLETISAAIGIVEDIAAGKRPESEARAASKQLGSIHKAAKKATAKNPEAALAEAAIKTALWATEAVSGGATAAEIAARASTHAVAEKQSPEIRKAIWDDFDHLVQLATADGWQDNTPVSPERFRT